MSVMSFMLLILDMDGTLIDGMTPRPYLEEFFIFIFENFKYVGIWTAAEKSWYEDIYIYIFKPILDKINQKFIFVKTRNNCKHKRINQYKDNGFNYSSSLDTTYIKPLRNIFKQKKLNFNKHNTLIIDDTPITYIENYGNGIPIPEFKKEKEDKVLKDIIPYLQQLIECYNENKTIRYTDKRKWYLSEIYVKK